MAATSLPKIGTEYGPYEDEDCGHRDCAKTREMADEHCYICGAKIGYEKSFYTDKDNGNLRYVHAVCYEDSIKR